MTSVIPLTEIKGLEVCQYSISRGSFTTPMIMSSPMKAFISSTVISIQGRALGLLEAFVWAYRFVSVTNNAQTSSVK